MDKITKKDIESIEASLNVRKDDIKSRVHLPLKNDKGEILHGPRKLIDEKYKGNLDIDIVNGKSYPFYQADYSWLTPCSDEQGFYIDCKKSRIDFERCLRNSPCLKCNLCYIKRQKYVLETGKLIKRYGSPLGSYAAPLETKYEELSLAYCRDTMQYHVYRVIKPICVDIEYGVTAPAFGQSGFGIQYYFSDDKGVNYYLGIEGGDIYLEEVEWEQ